MNCILINIGHEFIGHFDFSIMQKWMEVQYGAFLTSHPHESYQDWLYGCLKATAIEVHPHYRNRYRGIGRTLVSHSLYWGKGQGLKGMKIINPRTPNFWKKLNFVYNGPDQVFIFGKMRIPRCGIHLRKQFELL